MDNAGETKLLEKWCKRKDWKFNIEIEYTARDTPQQNSIAKVGFYMLRNRARAMMHQANIPVKERDKILKEAVYISTLLDGLVIVQNKDGKKKTRFMHVCKENPKFI